MITKISGVNLLPVLATAVVMVVVGSSSARADHFGGRHRGGYVLPCSLDGVNPVYHPDIFGSPSAAAAFGFVQSRDGRWHVRPGCVRGGAQPY